MQMSGWDLVMVTTFTMCNRILAHGLKGHPPRLDYQNEGLQLKGTFSEWEIIPGGSNALIWLKTTVAEGTFTGLTPQPVGLTGLEAVVELRLTFGLKTSSFPVGLQIDFHSATDAEAGGIRVRSLHDPRGEILKPAEHAAPIDRALREMFAAGLSANHEQLTGLLASLNQSDSRHPWLTLKTFQYLCLEPGHLAILGMVTEQDVMSGQPLVAPELATGLGELRIAFSKKLFLKHLLPSLNETRISCGLVMVGPIPYEPVIFRIQHEIAGALITTIASGVCNVTGLADSRIEFSVTSTGQLQFDSITRQARLTRIDPHQFHATPHITVPEELHTLGTTAGILIGFFKGKGLVIDSAEDPIEQIIRSITSVITSKVESVILSHEADIQAACTGALESVDWPGYSQWNLVSVELEDAVCLRYDPAPPPPVIETHPVASPVRTPTEWERHNPHAPPPFYS